MMCTSCWHRWAAAFVWCRAVYTLASNLPKQKKLPLVGFHAGTTSHEAKTKSILTRRATEKGTWWKWCPVQKKKTVQKETFPLCKIFTGNSLLFAVCWGVCIWSAKPFGWRKIFASNFLPSLFGSKVDLLLSGVCFFLNFFFFFLKDTKNWFHSCNKRMHWQDGQSLMNHFRFVCRLSDNHGIWASGESEIAATNHPKIRQDKVQGWNNGVSARTGGQVESCLRHNGIDQFTCCACKLTPSHFCQTNRKSLTPSRTIDAGFCKWFSSPVVLLAGVLLWVQQNVSMCFVTVLAATGFLAA